MNLFDFTYCGNYNRQIQRLAQMAPEKWDFGESGDNAVLKGYLEQTFRRLYEEGKVVETEEAYAIFNTGLFTRYYQPVYAYFVPNLVPGRQRWFLEGFYSEYSLLKGKNRRPSRKRRNILQIHRSWFLTQDLRLFHSMSIFWR